MGGEKGFDIDKGRKTFDPRKKFPSFFHVSALDYVESPYSAKNRGTGETKRIPFEVVIAPF